MKLFTPLMAISFSLILSATLPASAQRSALQNDVCKILKINRCDASVENQIKEIVSAGIPTGVGNVTAYIVTQISAKADSGRLKNSPNGSGYSILKFRLVEELGTTLNDLSKSGNFNNEIAQRSFGNWLTRLVSSREESFILAVEVIQPLGTVNPDGSEKVNLLYYQPIYAWSAGEAFRTVTNETYVKVNGTIGAYRKNSDPVTVRVTVNRAKANTISTTEIRKIISLAEELTEPFTDVVDGVTSVAGVNVASWVTDAASLATNGKVLDQIDSFLGRFEQTAVFEVSREMRYLDAGDTIEFNVDFHAPKVKYRQKDVRSSGKVGRMKLHVYLDFEESLLTRNEDRAGLGVRNKRIHRDGNLVIPLEDYVLSHDASKSIWTTVGDENHDTTAICRATIDALDDKLQPNDVLVGLSSMLARNHSEFSGHWPGEVACFGVDAAIFSDAKYRSFRFDPDLISEGLITDVPLPPSASSAKGRLPTTVSRFWRDSEAYGYQEALDTHIDTILQYFPSEQSQISLCDETGIFLRTRCSTRALRLDAYALMDVLEPAGAELLKVDSGNGVDRVVAIGCYHGDLFDTEEISSNRFGSIVVIGERVIEFVWGYRNKNGRPVLSDIEVSYPTTERLEAYKGKYPNGCGGQIKTKIWEYATERVATR